MKILLSVKPEYAKKILDGSKKYEFRKHIAKKAIDTIVIYSTMPDGIILGEVSVIEYIQGSPTDVWERTKHNSGISREKFREYFKGSKSAYAYSLDKPIRYQYPVPITNYGLLHAPQSFMYLKAIEVVAALILDDDKFMICQRPVNKARGLLWEFVGGKVEPGETKKQALVRECREELAITVAPADIFTEVDHVYPDITIHLTLFNCTIADGVPLLLEHNALKWIMPDEIPQYEFCPADTEILKLIKEKI